MLYIVTGAAGHLGSVLIRQLAAARRQVRGLILPGQRPLFEAPGVAYYQGDVTEAASLGPLFEGAEGAWVIHAAGLISISQGITPQMEKVNVKGVQTIVNLCLAHGAARLVYVSSVHALPEGRRGTVIREQAAFSPDAVVGGYAKTKAMASQLVMDAVAGGLNAVLVHPSGIIGPFDDGANHLVQLLRSYWEGKLPAGVRGGYDFADVRDVARGCLAAAAQGRRGEGYILSGRYATIGELMADVRLVAPVRPVPLLPVALARLAAPFVEGRARRAGKRPLFTRYSLHTLRCNSLFSHEKAEGELGYVPRDLKATVADTIFWLQGKAVSAL